MMPGDCASPHIQGVFYECDNYPEYPRGQGVHVINCFIEGRTVNTIYNRPGDNLNVINTTILQNQFGGLNIMNEWGTDSLIDTLWHSPLILVASATASGRSFFNNTIKDSVYFGHDFNTGAGDKVLTSTQFLPASYGAQLTDYPVYFGPLRPGGAPALPLMSANAWKQLRILDSSYVLNATEFRRAAPKTGAAIHPNQQGKHYGCSKLFQDLGALP